MARHCQPTYGLRSPGGIGFNAEGDVFYTDNQGPWNGTCGLKQLVPGKFVGHPGGNRWAEKAANFKDIVTVKPKDNSRLDDRSGRVSRFGSDGCYVSVTTRWDNRPVFACDQTGGKFGPFANQLFVGDQTHSTIMRVDLEKVNGRYQEPAFHFALVSTRAWSESRWTLVAR